MHTLKGLSVSAAEVMALLQSDPFSAQDCAHKMVEASSRLYLEAHRDWLEQSVREFESAQEQGIQWSRIGNADYPQEWLSLSRRPLVFHYKGHPVWQKYPLLAIVGSRSPMRDSLFWMRRELPPFLRENHIGVVSGAARGIDQCAHRLSLVSDRPTVCVIPSGLHKPYPYKQEEFWSEILEGGGCLLSTFGIDESMRRHHFHIRNRWIAGMARLVFVVESNRRSGSTLTAKLALEEGREVCALPVFPQGEQGMGNLDILFDGGSMVRDRHDLKQIWEKGALNPTLF